MGRAWPRAASSIRGLERAARSPRRAMLWPFAVMPSRARSKPFVVQCQKSKSQYVIDEKTCDRWFKKPSDNKEVGNLTLVEQNIMNGN